MNVARMVVRARRPMDARRFVGRRPLAATPVVDADQAAPRRREHEHRVEPAGDGLERVERAAAERHLTTGAVRLAELDEFAIADRLAEKTGDRIADRAVEAIRRAGERGLRRDELRRGVFQRNVSADRLDEAIGALSRAGLVTEAQEQTARSPRDPLRRYGVRR
jgi:hypothetical protein